MAVAADADALKLVEVDRDEVAALPELFEALRGLTERFVVLCDDLSFEEGAAAAKALKSALEGGVAGPPENVMFVATSNRRHLMPRDHAEGRGAIAMAEDAEEEVSRVRPLRDCGSAFRRWIRRPTSVAVAAYAARFGLAIAGSRGARLAVGKAARRAFRPRRLAVHPRSRRRIGQDPAGV